MTNEETSDVIKCQSYNCPNPATGVLTTFNSPVCSDCAKEQLLDEGPGDNLFPKCIPIEIFSGVIPWIGVMIDGKIIEPYNLLYPDAEEKLNQHLGNREEEENNLMEYEPDSCREEKREKDQFGFYINFHGILHDIKMGLADHERKKIMTALLHAIKCGMPNQKELEQAYEIFENPNGYFIEFPVSSFIIKDVTGISTLQDFEMSRREIATEKVIQSMTADEKRSIVDELGQVYSKYDFNTHLRKIFERKFKEKIDKIDNSLEFNHGWK